MSMKDDSPEYEYWLQFRECAAHRNCLLSRFAQNVTELRAKRN